MARVLKFAFERGINGFAAILPNNVFGNQVAEVLNKESEFFGSDVRRISMVSNGDYNASAEEVADAYHIFSAKLDNCIKPILIPPSARK